MAAIKKTSSGMKMKKILGIVISTIFYLDLLIYIIIVIGFPMWNQISKGHIWNLEVPTNVLIKQWVNNIQGTKL